MATQIPMTTATGLGPLPDLLEAAGGSKAVVRAFVEEGVPLAVLEDRTLRIPLAAMVGLFDSAARIAREPRLGLNVGLEMAPRDYGLWLEYALQAPTLSGALTRLSRCLPLHQVGGSVMILPRAGDKVVWEYRHTAIRGEGALQHNDHVAPVMVRIVRAYCGPDWAPSWVESAARDPGDRSFREDAMTAPWRFESGGGVGVGLPAAALRTRRADSPPAAHPLTSAEVAADLRQRKAEKPVDRLASIVALRLLDQQTDIDGAAHMAGLGRRSLQRLLEGEGLTYRALLDRTRMTRARALIEETDEPMAQIGISVGYSDQAHFSRAFSRHFGLPPSALRASRPRLAVLSG